MGTTLNLPSVGSDTTLRAKYVRSTRFEIINSGTSGTVTLPSNSEVILNDFGGTVDAVVAQVSSSKPLLQPALTSTGEVVATSFDASGNWSFTGTPSAYPVAILYRVRQAAEDFDSDASNIWGNTTVEDRSSTVCKSLGSDFTTTLDTLQNVGLEFPIGSNEKWSFEFQMQQGMNNTGGMRYALDLPAGAVARHKIAATSTGSTAIATTVVEDESESGNIHTVNNQFGSAEIIGTIANGSTAGTVRIQARVVTAGQTLTIYGESQLRAVRIS
jgi:hypothetical protein